MFPGGGGAGARDERVADDLVELLTVTQRRVAAGVAAALAEDGGTLDGYRLPDPADGRKVVVHLSDPGRDRLRRQEALVGAHESALAASLGRDRVAALVRALDDLATGR